MKSKIVGLLAVGLLAGPVAANAGMVGSTLEVTARAPNISTIIYSENVVVGAGVEIPYGWGGFSVHNIDLSDSQIIFTAGMTTPFDGLPFNGFVFSDLLNNLSSIYWVTVDNSLYSGFNPVGVTWDANNIYVNFSAANARLGDRLVLNVTFVPEPGTLALLGLGLAGLGLSRRRKAN